MSLKRKIAVSGGLIFLLSLLLVCLLTGAFFYLPFYLETRIIPQLATDAGISDLAVNVRSIGFNGADLADLRFGSPDHPALVIRSVQVDYSPRSLYQRKIDKITLSGIDLRQFPGDNIVGFNNNDVTGDLFNPVINFILHSQKPPRAL